MKCIINENIWYIYQRVILNNVLIKEKINILNGKKIKIWIFYFRTG